MPEAAAPVDWDLPDEYERWYASPLGQAYAASMRGVLLSWLGEAPHSRVIDIGCGPGLVAGALFPRAMMVTGVDCSLQMARRARASALRDGRPGRVVAGSLEALPFRGQSFDLALCVNCLEFVEERRPAFEEIARVLVPGGTALIGVLNRRSLWEVTRRLRAPFTRRTYYRGRFFTEEALRAHLDEAGLDVAALRTVAFFPPVAARVLRRLHAAMESLGERFSSSRGAVILCRAIRRPGPHPEGTSGHA